MSSAEYHRIYNKKYNRDNKEKRAKYREENKESIVAYHSSYYKNKRDKFLFLYGCICVCCGEDQAEFLTIEHKLGQIGKKKESSFRAYTKAITEYRPDLYEILCMNCNHARGRYGKCPHQK